MKLDLLWFSRLRCCLKHRRVETYEAIDATKVTHLEVLLHAVMGNQLRYHKQVHDIL